MRISDYLGKVINIKKAQKYNFQIKDDNDPDNVICRLILTSQHCEDDDYCGGKYCLYTEIVIDSKNTIKEISRWQEDLPFTNFPITRFSNAAEKEASEIMNAITGPKKSTKVYPLSILDDKDTPIGSHVEKPSHSYPKGEREQFIDWLNTWPQSHYYIPEVMIWISRGHLQDDEILSRLFRIIDLQATINSYSWFYIVRDLLQHLDEKNLKLEYKLYLARINAYIDFIIKNNYQSNSIVFNNTIHCGEIDDIKEKVKKFEYKKIMIKSSLMVPNAMDSCELELPLILSKEIAEKVESLKTQFSEECSLSDCVEPDFYRTICEIHDIDLIRDLLMQGYSTREIMKDVFEEEGEIKGDYSIDELLGYIDSTLSRIVDWL